MAFVDVYETVDLSPFANAGRDILGDVHLPAIGEVSLRGLPFRIGDPGHEGRAFVGFGPGLRTEALRIPLDREARSIIVAHLLLDSDIQDGGPIGELVADYVFEVEGADPEVHPIREVFEIGALAHQELPFQGRVPTLVAASPMLAYPDRYDSLHPRREGSWSDAGRRMTESTAGVSEGYKLWAWRNRPGQHVGAIEIRPRSRRFLIAGITVGLADEDPFVRVGREPVRVVRLEPADAGRPDDVEIVVDRGVATYAWPTIPTDLGDDAAPGTVGWGQEISPSSPLYAEVAAIPSATLDVRQAGRSLGRVRWGDVISTGSAQNGKVRVEWVDNSRAWVSTTVVDSATGRPVPCRIHFRSPTGIPYQPHGHHNHVNGDVESWHVDVGGDIRFGAVPYAVIDGRCQGWLPVGDVLVEVIRGFEYEPLRTVVRIEPGQRQLSLDIRRWVDLRAERWWSGDTHVHFLSVDGGHLEAGAEDLHVVNLLQAQWGHLFTNVEDFTGRPSVSLDGDTIVHVGQENRQHVLGHLGLLGLREPVMPWSSDGPGEAEIGGSLETTLSHWADEGRARGALVTVPHGGYPNGEIPALVATGRADAFEMIMLGRYFHEEYYRYLNAGYRMPLVGGTDKMSNECPVGLYRTYVRLGPDEAFGYDTWARNLAAGRTFLSGGPIVRLEVEGREIGDTLTLPAGGGTMHVKAVGESASPIQLLQVVAGGAVVAEARNPEGARRLEIDVSISVEKTTWLAARVGGPDYYDARSYLDYCTRGAFAHTSPIYVSCGPGDWWMADDAALDYMVTRVDLARAYVRDIAPSSHSGQVSHPHGEADHQAFLERPFLEARAALIGRRRARD